MALLGAALSHAEIPIFLLSLAALLGLARLFGEVAKMFRQPAVLGEILAGIVLGPTVLGTFAPEWSAVLFPKGGAVETGLSVIMTLSVIFFLLVAGMEVDLSMAWRSGRTSFIVSITGIIIPFASGFALAFAVPEFMHIPAGIDPLVFALFFGTALSITALPVISKILMDLNLFRTDIGVIIVAAAIVNDLVGWLLFAVICSMIGIGGRDPADIGRTIAGTLVFVGVMLTVGRALLHRLLPWLQANTSRRSGVMGFAMVGALLCAALTEWIGIHAIFGSFIFGVALGDSRHLKEKIRASFDQFISSVFAPLFFAGLGLKVNFVQNLDVALVLAVLAVATVGKIVGCGYGAVLGGLQRRAALAVGFGMNARGAMEIILGALALQAGVIEEKLFVALVIMALLTSMISGTCMQKLLARKRELNFAELLSANLFKLHLAGRTREEVIAELSELAAVRIKVSAAVITASVLEREAVVPTGIGNRVAVPHARMEGLTKSYVVVGMSESGVDFDAPDGEAARIVFLVLTPEKDTAAHLQILAGIAKAANEASVADDLSHATNYSEVVSALRNVEESH
ncbi:MAG TPA: cation:proton antiporter [Candidatus Sumerlaeota bacterium]|nr:cation:proton antiporter [Candidatus Sumerlaeota bacterium]